MNSFTLMFIAACLNFPCKDGNLFCEKNCYCNSILLYSGVVCVITTSFKFIMFSKVGFRFKDGIFLGLVSDLGILFAWWYASRLVTTNALWGKNGSPIKKSEVDDFLMWAVVGIILGGRLGYILFYDFQTYLADPFAILAIWRGGMSFHGGLAGVTIAMILFARSKGFSPFSLFDIIAASCGIGIFLGRVTNFINSDPGKGERLNC